MSQMPPPPVDPVLEMPMPEDPPAWPKVVGIISIVWGSLGLACGTCFFGWILYLPTFSKQMEAQMGGPMPPAMTPSPAQMGLMVVGLLWALVLLSAGIATVGRKASGRTLHLVYAIGAILLTLPSLGLSVKQQMEMADWASKNPTSKWAQQSKAGPIVGLSFGAVMGLGWPVFCLVWFAPKKRSPDVNAPDAPVA
jgi:hypothetical protein